MVLQERKVSPERPFEGKNIYFSASIAGAKHANPDLPLQIVTYMQENGANVLSEHVAQKTPDEKFATFKRRTGIDVGSQSWEEQARTFRRADMEWVDTATHIVSLVDAASLGVGMELQRALDNQENGRNNASVLCLVHEESLKTLSALVRGAQGERFLLRTYEDIQTVNQQIHAFLTTNK